MTLPRAIARDLGEYADRKLLALAEMFERASSAIAAWIRRRKEARNA